MKFAQLAGVAAILIALPLGAADPPKTSKAPDSAELRRIGSLDAKLGQLSGNMIAIKLVEIEQKKSSSGRSSSRIRLEQVENEYDYDMASDVMFRTRDLPKGAEGKARQFTSAEYAKLREPAGAPGFKADRAEFHAGQIVRVFFGKDGPNDRPIVTAVMLLKDAPKTPEKTPEKPKKKKSDPS